jgi:hypothetical protein
MYVVFGTQPFFTPPDPVAESMPFVVYTPKVELELLFAWRPYANVPVERPAGRRYVVEMDALLYSA